MTKLFQFGERLPEYSVPVLNEREVRAAAGILLLGAAIGFFHAFWLSDFTPMRLVLIAFFIDFFLRVLINPRFAPSLVLGRLMVRGQEPEYTGAPQKRFAWAIGLVLASVVMVMVFGLNMVGPLVLAACLLCLVLMFFETAFGICIGCTLYNLVYPGQAKLCPGGACSLKFRAPISETSLAQVAVVVFVAALLVAAAPLVAQMDQPLRPGFSAAIGQ